MKATALQTTMLTKALLDSSDEKDARQVFEVFQGSEFELRAIAPHLQGNKRLATFGTGLGPEKYNTWFLFVDHWDIEGNPRGDYQEATVPRAASESTPVIKIAADWLDGRNDLISQFFTEYEVTNGDERRIPEKDSEVERNVFAMARELDKVRAEWGAPIGVTSWYRPPAVNKEIGGASFSQHLNGGAVDIYALDGRDYAFEDFLDAHWGGGLGYGVASGRGFTHLDLREGGWRRGSGTIRWTY